MHNVLLAPELSMRLYYVEILGLISHIHNINTGEYLQYMFSEHCSHAFYLVNTIPGHIFMMVFCCLLIAYEEERFYRPEHFIKTVEIVSPAETLSSDNEDDEPVKKWTENQEKCVLPDVLLQFMDRFVTSIVFVIFSVFNLMMIMTTLYFHTPIEKVLGVAMGVCGYVLISFKYPWLCFPQNCKTISRKK